MAGEPLLTVVGNAANDAELRFLPNGTAVAAFTVAVTPRIKKGDDWTDGETTWFRCTVWREMAEQVAQTVTKGMRLIVHGKFKTRQYDRDGQTRTSIEIDVEEVGPSLRYATAKVNKMERSGGQVGDRQPTTTGARASSGFGGDDPWASSAVPATASTGGRQSSFDDEPPF